MKSPVTPVSSTVSGESNYAGNPPASNIRNFHPQFWGILFALRRKTKEDNTSCRVLGVHPSLSLPALAHLGMLRMYLEPWGKRAD